jgi:cell shape-determining protein MreD
MWGEELTVNLFGITLLGSVIVAAVVEKLKVWLGTTGWVNTALALGVGVALGGLIYLLELLLARAGMVHEVIPLIAALVQGLFSGGIAAGLWRAARTLGRKK